MYKKALDNSGYRYKLTYKPDSMKKPKARKRNITWFNPPFNLDVRTNVAAKFLSMIEKHFPRQHPLHKIFNRNTVKVSYSTTRNLTKHITRHNNNFINKSKTENHTRSCNCRKRDTCPLRGECLVGPLVYQAEVETDFTSWRKYVGSAGDTFKSRYTSHKYTFKHENVNSTALSSHVWKQWKKYKIFPKII